MTAPADFLTSEFELLLDTLWKPTIDVEVFELVCESTAAYPASTDIIESLPSIGLASFFSIGSTGG